MNGKKRIHAFTMVELMIVVVIIGVIAAFGIPNFQRAVHKAQVREAVLILKSIHAANEVFRLRNAGVYWAGGPNADIIAINTGLGLNLMTSNDNYTYAYTRNSATTYTVNATWVGGLPNYSLSLTEAALSDTVPRNPFCDWGNEACLVL